MSENCSACGAKRTMFEGQTSWDCGSYQSLIGGSHIKTPQFKLVQSELCKARVDLATLRAQVAKLNTNTETRMKEYRAKIEELETAKANYHDKWLNALEKLRAAEQDNARLRESISGWVEAYANTLDERMAADRRRNDNGAYAANETVLADLDTLAALLAKPEGAK